MKPGSLFLLFFLVIPTLLNAGQDPVKFGKVSLEELKMTTYAADTSASAVVLCDYGCFFPDRLIFIRVTRIKILNKAGFNQANITFPEYREASVRGITYNLVNGEIVKTKLESSSIFRENITDDRVRLRITMPDVGVGSVIDIEFTHFLIPNFWTFQRDIPVIHSELRIPDHPNISFRKQFSGFEKLPVFESDRWIAKNMPAFLSEPYTNSPWNYESRLSFEITELRISHWYYGIAKTWEHVSKLLLDHDYFGTPLNRDGYISKAAEEIRKKGGTDTEKLRHAHDYIKKFVWNKETSVKTSAMNLSLALEKQSGNSADINIALIQLLRKLDFKVTPVLMSTRDNGELIYSFPCYWNLNYVIAMVEVDGKHILMDGTEKYAPYYILPERCLNTFGMTCNADFSNIVMLEPTRKEKESVLYNLTLEPNLQLRGTLSVQRSDYAALKFRNEYKEYSGLQSYLDAFVKRNPGLKLEDAGIENIDSVYLPVKEEYKISLKNMADAIDTTVYIYPMLLHKLIENPFKPEKRLYPVNFAFPREGSYSVKITLPEGWKISSWPEAIKIGLPEDAAYFLYQVTPIGNSINLTYRMIINKPVFPAAEYPELREFYNQIVAKHNEAIVVKRK